MKTRPDGSPLRKYATFPATLVVVVAATSLAISIEGISDDQSIPRTYHGVRLQISKARSVDRIPLGTVIFTPLPSEEGYVQLEFPRNAVSKEFLEEFFLSPSSWVRGAHPFSQRGIESILTKDSLIVRLHFGVVLHLRNDMPGMPDYKTFSAKNPQARLVTFGHETYLGKPKTPKAGTLQEFFVAGRAKECVQDAARSLAYTCQPGEYFPQMYRPRIE